MKWECVHCGELEKGEVTEELIGDQSFNYCNRCGGGYVSRIYEPVTQPEIRTKPFCFFIKPKWGYHSKYGFSEQYTRFEEICLALRIGYFREAVRLLLGKTSNYIWEGTEENPMPW